MRGFTREDLDLTSDHALNREARSRLVRSGYSALGDLACEVRGGRAILRGELPSFYLKQVAQAAVAEVEGVRVVINHVQVARAGARPAGRDRKTPEGAGAP